MTSQLSPLNSQLAAPAMQDAEPIFTPQQLEEMLMRRGNPLPQLTAQTLTAALDAFDLGYLQPAARLWEKLVTRDRWLKTVKDKREEAIELRPVRVEKTEDSPDAENQQRVLEVFFANVRAAHATNRQMTGGVSKLFAQMMESVSTMYAVHHLLWEPDAEQTFDLPSGGSVPTLKLTAEFVPLEYFEARTGALRFLGSDVGYYGQELQPGHWMTTTGPGLLIAASIAIWEARLARHDRMNLSEKWGQPAILGHTTSAKDSPEGKAMKAAVTSIAANYRGVNYGAGENKIESFWPTGGGGSSGSPMKEILDDVKRDLITLYLGSDLSTASREQSVGASVQGDSSADKQAADCQRIADTINATLVPIVIQWYFGDTARVLAKLVLEAPDHENQAQLLLSVQGLAAMMPPDTGIAIEPVAKRLGVPIAKAKEAVFVKPAAPAPAFGAPPVPVATNTKGAQRAATNAGGDASAPSGPDSPALGKLLATARMNFGEALSADLKPLRTAIAHCLQGDDATLPARSAALLATLNDPAFSAHIIAANGSADALEEILSAALANGLSAESPAPAHP